jgi:hypothetical protein
MAGQDIVYANLAGDDIDRQANSIVDAMNTAGVTRLLASMILRRSRKWRSRHGEN